MNSPAGFAAPARQSIRWYICLLLFASTVINYLDRQTLSLLAPFLKETYRWRNSDYANLVIGFRVAYGIGQLLCGRWIDRFGTRRSITFSVSFYSIVSIVTPLASSLLGFLGFRFMLGLGESANWPAATKAVSEWFPASERGLATAFFDSGSSVGGAITPFLVFFIYTHWGWRPAFIVPGVLGLLWLILWRRFYYPPQEHPSISKHELEMLRADKAISGSSNTAKPTTVWELLKFPQTWGTIAARALTDPVWFFVADWFPIYLVAKGIDLRNGLLSVWVPFIAADAGNFTGGAVSGWLIRRGWRVGAARRAIALAGGLGTMLLIPTVLTTNLFLLTVLFAGATFSYACFSTIANVLPSDLNQPSSVATVSGMSGAVAALLTVIAMKAVGYFSDSRKGMGTHAFDPIMIASGCIPVLGMILVMILVRNTRATDEGKVLRI
ncbi:MFS transporter [Terriglobus sp. 2YAB30_2]|uniref:MFS transporter n=1 Tax=unclassified Terriglobus TaxID=2628988 RepID=UPI003F94D978